MASSGPDRTYEDGRREWREERGAGYVKHWDSNGNSGWETSANSQGWYKRDGEWVQDRGSYIKHSDGTWERKWDH